MRLRFVCGRPVSAVTCLFLAWLTTYFAAQGKRALVLIWDNASWHISQEVRQWIRAHNRTVKQRGGCRLIMCRLPSKSPWLNPIEPKWVHGKRAVSEPVRTLAVAELMQRICTYYNCALEDLIVQEGCQKCTSREFHAVRFMEKRHTNSGLSMELTGKHSIYTHGGVVINR